MTTIHRATPDAKSEAAPPPEWLRRPAIEALTGWIPTEAQLAAMEKAIAGAPPVVSTYRKAGRIVASAALVPCPSIAFGDLADVFEPAENVRNALTRKAGTLIAGCAAERYAMGALSSNAPEMVLVAFMSTVVSAITHDHVENTLDDFARCSACAIGPNWGIVENVECRLRTGNPVLNALARVRISKVDDGGGTSSHTKAEIQKQSYVTVDQLVATARKLSTLGSARQ